MFQLELDALALLLLLSVAYGLLLVILLVFKGPHSTSAKYWLAGFILIYCLGALNLLFSRTGVLVSAPHLMYVVSPLAILVGPIILQYVSLLTFNKSIFNSLAGVTHILPFVIGVMGFLPFYLQTEAEKIHGPPQFLVPPFLLFAYVQATLLFYMWKANQLLVRFNVVVLDNYSSIRNVDMRWLKLIIMLVIARIIYGTLVWSVAKYFHLSSFTTENLFTSIVIIIVMLLSYLGVVHPDRIPQSLVLRSDDKYQKSSIDEGQAYIQSKKLQALMEEQKLYLESGLTLQQLAQSLAITPHHLSQLLNNFVGQSFYDYVNEFRVTFAKAMLLDNTHCVIEVAYASGFNNKTSFYNAFRQSVGDTPVAWLKKQKSL